MVVRGVSSPSYGSDGSHLFVRFDIVIKCGVPREDACGSRASADRPSLSATSPASAVVFAPRHRSDRDHRHRRRWQAETHEWRPRQKGSRCRQHIYAFQYLMEKYSWRLQTWCSKDQNSWPKRVSKKASFVSIED